MQEINAGKLHIYNYYGRKICHIETLTIQFTKQDMVTFSEFHHIQRDSTSDTINNHQSLLFWHIYLIEGTP